MSSEKLAIDTAMSNKRSLVVFVVAIILIIGLIFVFRTYKELKGETIVIESEADVTKAEETIVQNIEGLKQDVNTLRSIIS